ncbi:MAG: hypothetical protein H6Q04_3512, partial [Acidobacteria bacterium]|nr:hypothetical protein [Acidobacteriota bacterium]
DLGDAGFGLLQGILQRRPLLFRRLPPLLKFLPGTFPGAALFSKLLLNLGNPRFSLFEGCVQSFIAGFSQFQIGFKFSLTLIPVGLLVQVLRLGIQQGFDHSLVYAGIRFLCGFAALANLGVLDNGQRGCCTIGIPPN